MGYSLESPRRGDSNEYPQDMFLWRTDENYPSIIIKYPPYLFHWINTWTSCRAGGWGGAEIFARILKSYNLVVLSVCQPDNIGD